MHVGKCINIWQSGKLNKGLIKRLLHFTIKSYKRSQFLKLKQKRSHHQIIQVIAVSEIRARAIAPSNHTSDRSFSD
ncbi:hypothetical protein [Nostoc sp.]|uniref:hypothetical protein n=1 Tax=Nostoc sp. TaxID=1180 RepID=UPI002FF76991